MDISIRQNHVPHAVFSYEFEARTVYVGHSPSVDVQQVGKFCQILDVEYQRRLGTPPEDLYFGDPSIRLSIYEIDLEYHAAQRVAEAMRGILKPVWSSGYDKETARRYNPHIMHVETRAIFPTAHAASLALAIGSAHAYNIVDRPMLLSGNGRPPVAHLVTSGREVTHNPMDKRYGGLSAWREANGYGQYNK